MSDRRPSPPPECAQCGAAIPPGAHACPACGADERTGWREPSVYDGLDLPESAWENERSDAADKCVPDRRGNGIRWYWWCIAVGVALAFGLTVLGLW